VEKIQFANKGDFTLGVMAGFPRYGDGMPIVSLDGMWGLKDGLFHTNRFGENGAIDLGFYIGYAQNNHSFHYYDWSEDQQTLQDMGMVDQKSCVLPVSVRSAFHWEFVKNLDLYAGLQTGISYRRLVQQGNVYIGGPRTRLGLFMGGYLGAKWMFTKSFGVKAEFNGTLPPVRLNHRNTDASPHTFMPTTASCGIVFKF